MSLIIRMNIHKLISEIFTTQQVTDSQGKKHTLSSNIDFQEGRFIAEIIRENQFKNTIEIGCAMGISSLFICEALGNQHEKHHTIIDPMQTTDWSGIGIENLKRSGVDFYELIEQPSEIALPRLLAEGKKYDFGFIDGWHTFDHTLLDFFYLNSLLKVGGVIVIDDVSFKGIKKAVRYMLTYPCYEMLGTVSLPTPGGMKSFLYNRFIPGFFSVLSAVLPVKMRPKIFDASVLDPVLTKKLNCSMIALRKIAEDDRRWDWYESF